MTEIEELVIQQIRDRRDAGRAKYGTTMERTDLTIMDWLQHAQEEALDHAIYLERIKQDVQVLATGIYAAEDMQDALLSICGMLPDGSGSAVTAAKAVLRGDGTVLSPTKEDRAWDAIGQLRRDIE